LPATAYLVSGYGRALLPQSSDAAA